MLSSIQKIILFYFFSFIHIAIFSQNVITTHKEKSVKILPNQIMFLEDKSAQLKIEEIIKETAKFRYITDNKINFGYTKSAIWLKLEIKNLYFLVNDYILDMGIPTLDYVDLYYFDVDTKKWVMKKTGDCRKLSERETQTRQLLFHLFFSSEDKDVFYIRIKTNASLQANLQIAPKETIFSEIIYIEMAYAFFFGMLGVMLFYNFFLFITLKDWAYFWYTMTVLGTIFFIASLVGHSIIFLFPENIFWSDKLLPMFSGFLVSAAATFLYVFVNVRKYTKIGSYLLYFLIISGMFLFILPLFYNQNAGKLIIYGTLLGLVSVIINLIVVVICIIKKSTIAKFYLFAFSFYIAGVFVLVLRNLGVLPINTFTQYAVESGASLEILFLAFALSNKYNKFRKEKEDATKDSLRIQKEANETLEQKVKLRTQELSEVNEELGQLNHELNITLRQSEIQKNELTKKNEDITASISYASRIQIAILPLEEEFEKTFGKQDYFIWNKPRDIVSGDFYWLENTEDYIILAVGDCTGHGVPGALMSMIGVNFLDEIVRTKKITSPDCILNELHKSIRISLKQKESNNRDGMDISIITIDKKTKKIEFAAAKNPAFVIFNNQIVQLRPDKMPIGGEQREQERIFTKINVFDNDTIPTELSFYLFSDGYQDQFGGKEDKKFMIKNMREMIFKNHLLPFIHQKEMIETIFESWKGKNSQIDDVLVVGVKIKL
ncbi:MAG: hypothetical protein EAZ85_05300 [Bacteroidetes bacterium]|nr:MAG: hypothetical protein EAZ85_05300 [Bacteroidota bacterium]TAG90064.1 MAG: hypothetical protein EAZ20_05105 [Bacteroidota bacterium]